MPDGDAARRLWRYLGDGSSNPSTIPARDLTDADWAAFTTEQQAAVVAHPQLYAQIETTEGESNA